MATRTTTEGSRKPSRSPAVGDGDRPCPLSSIEPPSVSAAGLGLIFAEVVTGSIPSSSPDRPRRRSFKKDRRDRKSTRLNSSHANISYAVFCLKKKKKPKAAPLDNL